MAIQVSSRYRLGEFELEPATHCLKREHESIHLPELPFQVLLYLVENHERYVSRQELLERFWSGATGYEETLTKCISTIRLNLNDPPTSPRFIETRKKVGYRYIGPLEETPGPAESSRVIEKTVGVRIVVEEDSGPGWSAFRKIRDSYLILSRLRVRTWVISGTLATAVLIFGATIFLLQRVRTLSAPSSFQIRSIAVLPLKNLTGDPENEYFSDGVTESLITTLSKVRGLKVISSSSVFHFRDRQTDPREVGRQLNVAAVLEGTVRKDQDSVRVVVRLVATDDGRVLWVNDTRDRALPDIFSMQDEIARNVVANLRVNLNPENEGRITKRYTDNLGAYQAYLRGRYHWDRWTPKEAEKSIEYFQQAINQDPDFALPYTGLVDAYMELVGMGAAAPNDVMPKAKVAATKALALDDELAEAHTSLAVIKDTYDWDFPGAQREFKRALELNPNSSTAHYLYAKFLPDATGKFDEAFGEMRQALELDPLSVGINKDLGELLFYSRQYDRAIEQWNKTLELEPGFATAYNWLSRTYEAQGKYDLAIEILLKRYAAIGMPEAVLTALRATYAKSGWRGYWVKQLDDSRTHPRPGYSEPYFKAWLCLRAGQQEQALTWLEAAFANRSPWVATIRYDPLLDSLRSDHQFQKLAERIPTGVESTTKN